MAKPTLTALTDASIHSAPNETRSVTKAEIFSQYAANWARGLELRLKLNQAGLSTTQRSAAQAEYESVTRLTSRYQLIADKAGWAHELTAYASNWLITNSTTMRAQSPVSIGRTLERNAASLRRRYLSDPVMMAEAANASVSASSETESPPHVQYYAEALQLPQQGPSLLGGLGSDVSRLVNQAPVRYNSMAPGLGRDMVEALDLALPLAITAIGNMFLSKALRGHSALSGVTHPQHAHYQNHYRPR